MFRVITVSREFGSGGSIVARKIAEKLRWNLLDRSLITAVARAAQVDADTAERYDEHVESWWRRFNQGGLRSAAIFAGIAPDDAQVFDAETEAMFAGEVMQKAAARGDCVIVGRGAQCVLQDREDVLHVLIYAPWAERVERVRARSESSQNVEELTRMTDDERATYIRTYYGCDWKDPHLYHMMINSQIGTEMAACMIVNAINGGASRDYACQDRTANTR
jgi:cytidylate kinase